MSCNKSVYIWMLMLVLMSSSCEKVIDINLNDSVSQIVIEGEMTNDPGPYKVTVTQSKNFNENNSFPGRNDAVVVITDRTAQIAETLTNAGSGTYFTEKMRGVPGHTYFLRVTLKDTVYTATSTMPLEKVELTALYSTRSSFDSDNIFMVPIFTDPAGNGNYYRLKQFIRGIQVKGSVVRSDEATDGRTFDTQLYYRTEEEYGNPLINLGDDLVVELQSIDKGVYDFYRTLNTTIDQDASTPANPLTNIKGGALGVFNACQSSKFGSTAKF